MRPTNAQVIAHDLKFFHTLEDYQKDVVADFISCPGSGKCEWDGNPKNTSVCIECKVRWLEQEWGG